MKGVILVGGMGTRLRPITYEIPKPLVPVKKRPIINHLIQFFARYGVSEIALLASRSHEDDFRRWKKTWLDELPHRDITIFFEEKPRGTFGGFELVKKWAGGEPFFVANGDDLKDWDLGAMIRLHHAERAVATIALIEVPDAREKGVPVLERNRVKAFSTLERSEHPQPAFINAGVYVFDPKVFDYAGFSQEYLMIEKDLFPALAAAGVLCGYEIKGGRFYDCGTLERWEKAMKEW